MKLILKVLVIILSWINFVFLAFFFVLVSLSIFIYETLEGWRAKLNTKATNNF